MAKHPKTKPSKPVVPRKISKWSTRSPKEIGLLLLSIAIVLLVVVYQQQPEDVYIDHSIWSEVYMPDKHGIGVIAKRNLSRGSLIIREKPLLMAQTEDPPSAEYIAELVATLPWSKRRAFEALSSHGAPNRSKYQAIWKTNSFYIGSTSGVFERHARLNHGCASSKNVGYNWNEETGMLETRAIQDIAKGEELLTEYVDTTIMTRSQRQDFLREKYNFECKCAVCMLPEEESLRSDSQLASLGPMVDQVKQGTTGNGLQTTQLINRILQLTEEEGIPSGRAQIAWFAAVSAAMHSDEDAAREWSALAEKWAIIEIGAENAITWQISGFARNPKGFKGWGIQPRMLVERPIALP